MKLRSLAILLVMLALVNPMFQLSKDKNKSKDTVVDIVLTVMFPP